MFQFQKFAGVIALAWIVSLPSTCWAHFLWLVPQNHSGSEVQLYFSEGPEPDNPKLLQKLTQVTAQAFRNEGKPVNTAFEFNSDQTVLSARSAGATAWRLDHTYGIFGQESKSLLRYTAASVACGWEGMGANDHVHLPKDGMDLLPTIDGTKLSLQLFHLGEVASDLKVDFQSPNDHQSLTTNAKGILEIPNVTPGVYAIRTLAEDTTPGTHEGVAYQSTKHYTTISFVVPDMTKAKLVSSNAGELGELPQAITSFGATAIGDVLYAFGGHTGGAHSYSNDEQFNKLIKLDLSKSKQWETIAEGARVQGNALVAYGDQVILVGGFTAENAKGEKSRLVSQASVQKFDLKTGQWSDLPSLPEPRSSMDASVLDGYVYAVGGWAMNGNGGETKWHETAWRLSLANTSKGWESIAKPPFQRRAIATASHQGKLYVVGGMESDGDTTTETCVYDPATNSWSTIGTITGVPMNGFGAALFEMNGRLVATAVDGSIQQLDDATGTWEIIGHVGTGRFFHRALPVSKDTFVIFGGANMEVGKFRELDMVQLSQ